MDVGRILDLIVKGLGVASALIAAGMSAKPALDVLFGLATGAQTGAVTDEQLAQNETTLDALIVDFNLPIT